MKLKFLGVGGMFAPLSVGNSNMMFTSDGGKILIFDMGYSFPYIFRDEWNLNLHDIDALWLSHSHADHSASVEFFAFYRYFVAPVVKPKLYMVDSMFPEIWDNTLKGGLESVQGKVVNLKDYFECFPIRKGKSFTWEHYKFTPIQTIHIVSGYLHKFSYGLLIESPSGFVTFITGDTQYAPSSLATPYEKSNLIFHDCDTSNYPEKNSIHAVHAHYMDLKTLPVHIKNKMWMYHYNKPVDVFLEDGFLGFVQKGQEFDI